MPKRKNTSIKEYQLKSGAKRFMFKIYIGQKNGKKVETTRRGFKSYAEAETAYNKLRLENATDFVKQKQITVQELYDLWFENYKTQVKQSTAYKNEQIFHNHVSNVFGNRYIDSITVAELQKWADNKAKEIVKYRDVINEFNVIFEYGMRLNYVSDNPLKKIIVPKKTARKRRDIEHNVYSREELDRFIEVASHEPIMKYTYFKIISSTGMRKSEVLALTWKDIDFTNKTISVNKTLAYGLGGKVIMQPPKSPKSRRTLPISPSLLDVLLKYKQEQKVRSEKLFCTYDDKYLTLGRPDSWLQSIYKKDHNANVKYAKEHDLDVDSYTAKHDLRHITIHGFRHTFATLLISETNIKPKTVQMLLGHENIEITLDLYTHINEENQKEASSILNELNI